jgi:DNA-binding PadR family transcriptional regulator
MNDLLLLATLLAGPTHGYALKRKIGLMTGQGDLHNNLVYPLLKRFVRLGWVGRKTAEGERGQTREIYSLAPKGKRELFGRLSVFPEKEAASRDAFLLRLGLFDAFDEQTRRGILEVREKWLANREGKLTNLEKGMTLGKWAGEAVGLLLSQVRAEKKWMGKIQKKALGRRAMKRDEGNRVSGR